MNWCPFFRLGQVEAEKTQQNNVTVNGRPTLNMIGKSNSVDGKYSRASLTRGGSQEDPSQLMRDLQDSVEREADIREQLKYAEEEAENLQKKITRIEDENESLMVQLKKMASKSRSELSPLMYCPRSQILSKSAFFRNYLQIYYSLWWVIDSLPELNEIRTLSPTLTVDSSIITERDEGVSDEEDPAELRVLFELNERESSQLRRKVEELETENNTIKTQLKELRDTPKTPTITKKLTGTAKDKEIAELQKKLVDMEKNMEILKKSSSKTTIQSKVDEKKAAQETRVLNEKVDSLNLEISKL